MLEISGAADIKQNAATGVTALLVWSRHMSIARKTFVECMFAGIAVRSHIGHNPWWKLTLAIKGLDYHGISNKCIQSVEGISAEFL